MWGIEKVIMRDLASAQFLLPRKIMLSV